MNTSELIRRLEAMKAEMDEIISELRHREAAIIRGMTAEELKRKAERMRSLIEKGEVLTANKEILKLLTSGLQKPKSPP